MINLRTFVLLLCTLLITGCAPVRLQFPRTRTTLSKEDKARVYDLSFPLDVEPTKLLFSDTQLVMSYSTDLSFEQLAAHYATSMEYWGWQELGAVHAAESVLMYLKPSKVCSISVRQEGRQKRVTVFVTARKS